MNFFRSCYLAGPIAGLVYEEATDWRVSAADKLSSLGVQALSPMRGKSFLRGTGPIGKRPYDSVLASDAGITTRDRFDVMRSDAVLFNLLGTESTSIGTMIEIGWADALRKPIILAIEDGNVHWHPMVRAAAGYLVSTLDEAVDIVGYVLGTGAK